MNPNPLLVKLKNGETVYGTMAQDSRSPTIALLMAQAGCDFMFFDMEHGPNDLGIVADMIKVARLTKVVPLVRVPNDPYHLMARILDAGAMGVMIPRIETRSQVEAIIENTHFPPVGVRGCSVAKGHNDYLPQGLWEFTEQANRETMIILQIERKKAIENIEDLVSVEGVDAVVLGPNDLCLSMGIREKDYLSALEPEIQTVLDVAKKFNVPCGIHVGNLDWLMEWQRRGMNIIAYSDDIAILKNGVKAGLDKLREVSTK